MPKSIHRKPNRLSRGWGKYCSNKCKHTGLLGGHKYDCKQCGKEVYRNLTEQARSKNNVFFCNRSCQTKWRNSFLFSGENHPSWKGGEASYRERLLKHSKILICKRCGTKDVRVLAVHHKDKNRSNNTLGNLMWLCHNCHFIIHHYALESTGFIIEPVE